MSGKRWFAYAAAAVVVCAVLLSFSMPSLYKAKRSGQVVRQEQKSPVSERLSDGPVVSSRTASEERMRRAEIEYTQVAGKEVPSGPAATPEKSVLEGKVAAKLPEGDKVAMDRLVSLGYAKDREVAGDAKGMFYEAQPSPEQVVAAGQPQKLGAVKLHFGKEAVSTSGPLADRRIVVFPCEEAPVGYPMAHGGTTPPNGEDVDAMFFKNYGVNPFVDTEDDHLSTFATDVDTGAYTVCRGYLHDGHLPPNDAVRVEEFVNYFNYRYEAPQEDAFAVYQEAAPRTFGQGRKNSYLLQIGLKGRQVSDENRKPAVLTFVIDVSGSMNRENRLGLVKRALRMLVENLEAGDKVGIAVYGSRGRIVMEHRGLDARAEILAAIESLSAGGSTYAEEGIRIGYEMAERAYRKGCINRVILCSDGVANVGKTGADGILEVIKERAAHGITLSAIGFGMGNYNDVLLERLGDKGNGHYAYVDTIAEAKKLFEENLTGTLEVIARDVKIQVDFNPEVVRSYRLIGYENRDVPDDKFRDDKWDGGEIGAGHSVTALYELKLWPEKEGRIATTYVRYKHPETEAVTEFKSSIETGKLAESFEQTSGAYRLAATVGEFAEILRQSYWAKGASLGDVLAGAQQLSEEFAGDADVIELVDLISKAKQLMEAKGMSDAGEVTELEER